MTREDDITPPYYPVSLLRDALERAVDAQACAVMVVSKDGELWFDTCGHEQQSVLWALECMRYQVMHKAHDGK